MPDKVLDGPFPDDPFHFVAAAFFAVFPTNDEIVLRPDIVDGLMDPYTVIHTSHVADGVLYLVCLQGEHDLASMPVNPMSLERVVLGVQFIDGRLTVANELSEEDCSAAMIATNALLLVDYGEMLTTDKQPNDPNSEEWTVLLDEYPERVTCCRIAMIEYDNGDYSFYIGKGENGGNTEYFLLVVEVIDGKFFPVDIKDNVLWNALLIAFLNESGIEDDDDEPDEEFDEGDFTDINIC